MGFNSGFKGLMLIVWPKLSCRGVGEGENTGLQRHWQGIFCESCQHNITDMEITFSTIASFTTDFNTCHQCHVLGRTLQYLFVITKTGFFAILGIRILIFQLVPVIGLFL